MGLRRCAAPYHTAAFPSSPCVGTTATTVAMRYVQFEQTSETLRGINTKKKATTTKWVTRSTKDYMEEADSQQCGSASVVEQRREDFRAASAARKKRMQHVAKEADNRFETEMGRIADDQSRRWKKGINFFKRQGKAFTLLYIGTYALMWSLLYVGFATGVLKKDAAIDYTLLVIGTYIDRESFYDRVASFDTYVNAGFAFVINELLEFIRLPLLMGLFFTCRPFFLGVNTRVRGTIFRRSAAES